MKPFFESYQKQNPLRPADWRWQRACTQHVAGRRYSRRSDDEATERTLKYVRERARCATDRHRQRLARHHPELDPAFHLWLHGGDERTILEARLLAGQSADEIGLACALPAETVRAFEETFFDVPDRLAARSWVQLAVLGSPDVTKPPVEQVYAFVRRLAYYGGPLVLDLVLGVLQPLHQAARLLTGSRGAVDESHLDALTRRVRVLLLADGLPGGALKALRTVDFSAYTGNAALADWDAVFVRQVASAVDSVLEQAPQLCASEGEPTACGAPPRHTAEAA